MMSEEHAAAVAADHRQEIRRFILSAFLSGGSEEELGDDDLLFESGIIDSTGALELVVFLEQRYGIQVRDEELFPKNFASVEKIHAYVELKIAAEGADTGGVPAWRSS
jgi:acyl carrier protein